MRGRSLAGLARYNFDSYDDAVPRRDGTTTGTLMRPAPTSGSELQLRAPSSDAATVQMAEVALMNSRDSL
eukprot:scaffold241611_cov20-Prasinocladus_malaysianus.AAC.1